MATVKKPTQKEILEARKIRVDVLDAIQKSKADRVRFQQEEEKREADLQKLLVDTRVVEDRISGKADIFDMLFAVTAVIVDEEKTIGSEPVLKMLFTEKERQVIKNKMLEKIKKS